MLSIVGREQLQDCPAAVVVSKWRDPEFLINRQVFAQLPEAQQRFVLLHETGHWLLKTPSETAADTFALHATAGTEHDSLRNAVRTLALMPQVDPARTDALLRQAIQIDKHNQQNNNPTMKQILFRENGGDNSNSFTGRADGAEVLDINAGAAVPMTEDQRTARDAEILGQMIGGNNRRRLGIKVNNVFVTAETILLTAILATTIVIAARKR